MDIDVKVLFANLFAGEITRFFEISKNTDH